MLRQQLVGTVSGELAAPKTALEAFNRYQNEQRTIEYVAARPRPGRRHRRADAGGAREVFRGAQGLFRAPEYRKVAAAGAHAGRARAADRDLGRRSQEGLRGAQGALRRRRSAATSSRSCSRTSRKRSAAADKHRQGHDVRRARRRARPEGHRHRSRHRGQVRDGRPRGRRRRLRAQGGRGQRAGRRAASAPRSCTSSRSSRRSTQPFEEVAAELKQRPRDRARQGRSSSTCTTRSRTSGWAAPRSPRPPRSSISRRAPSRRSTAPAATRDGKPVADLPQGVDVLTRGVRRRRRRRERSAADSAGRRLRLVRRRRTSRRRATARSTRSRTRSRRAGATTRSPTRLQGQGRRDGRQAQGRHAVRARSPRPTTLKPEWRPGLKRGNPPPGIPARALDDDFPHAEGRRRQRRRRDADRAHRVPRHRDHRAAARCRIRPKPSASTRRCAARSPTTCWRSTSSRLENELGVTINQAALNQVTGGSPAN